MGFELVGVTANTPVDVDVSNRLFTVNPKTEDASGTPTNLSGGDRLSVESDAGLVTGVPMNHALLAHEFRRLQIGSESLLFHEVFNGAAVNTTQWNTAVTTFTTAVSGGRMILNSGSSVAANGVAVVKSYRTIPIYSGFCTVFEGVCSYQAAAPAVPNTAVELGLGFAATTAAPTDGVFFRWNLAGNFVCVVNFNGTETVSSALTPPPVNDSFVFRIVIGRLTVNFWINGILQCSVPTPAGAGLPIVTQNLPISIRTYNGAVGPTSAVQLAVYSISVYLSDLDSVRSYETAMAGIGAGAYQGQTGQTLGTTANHANSTAATAATLSNTAAGYAKLGGKFLFTTVAGLTTDYALFAFQVPAASANTPGKTLYIRGVHISSVNIGAAVAGTPTVLEWSIGVGSTAVSLATGEAAGTKAPRVVDLGFQSFQVAAGIGAQAPDLDVQFPVPLMCEPGLFVHIILNCPIGTVTASQQIMGSVAVNGFFE